VYDMRCRENVKHIQQRLTSTSEEKVQRAQGKKQRKMAIGNCTQL